jgi:hypothetical protein
MVSIGNVVELLKTTKPTANKAVSALVDAGVLRENSGRRRDRMFGYTAYMHRLRAGTELEAEAAPPVRLKTSRKPLGQR